MYPNQITAQIACEAISAMPSAFSLKDMQIVLGEAKSVGVDSFYTDRLAQIIVDHS